MLQKIFKVSLRELPPELSLSSPLSVGIYQYRVQDKDLLEKYLQYLQQGHFIAALLKERYAIYDSMECTFVRVQVLGVSAVEPEDGIIPLHVSQDFLMHYNFQYGENYYFKPVVCQSLQRVIIGAKTSNSYDLFNNSESLLKLPSSENMLLCRQSDAFLCQFSTFGLLDTAILDCQPFRQGLLSLTTSLVVTDLRDISKSKLVATKNRGSGCLEIDRSMLNLINYTNNNFLKIHFGSQAIFQSLVPFNTLTQLHNFQVRVITKLNCHFEQELFNVGREVDPLNIVYLSHGMSKKLNAPNGSWATIRLIEYTKNVARSPVDDPIADLSPEAVEMKPVGYSYRLAQVCCFQNEKASAHYFPSNKIAYMSPLLWFNLKKQPSNLVQNQLRLELKLEKPDFSPPFAKEATVNIVQSPNYDVKVNCDIMLTKYFELARYVCREDIFCADSRDELDFHHTVQDEDHDKLKWPVVYFRILIEGNENEPYFGSLISSRNTRLYQVGTKQSYIPVTMEEYYSPVPIHPIQSSIPEGLMHYVNTLQNIIMPFLKLQNEKCKLSSNILFTGPPCCGKTAVIKAVCRCLNLHLYQLNCHELIGEGSAAIETRLKNKTSKGLTYAPCIILFKNIHFIGKEKETGVEDSRVIELLAELLKNMNSYGSPWPVVVIGTTGEAKINSSLQSAFLHTVKMKAPNEEERLLLLQDLLSVCEYGSDVSTRYLAQRTAGFVLGDLSALVHHAIGNAYSRIREHVQTNGLSVEKEEDIVLASAPVIQRDLLVALEKLQSKFAEALGAPKIPNVKFEDVGGLADVKQEILDTIQLPLEHPEILLSGLRRSGVLLYGPPGSGKTMLAKAVATECSLNFLSVKGPELINMYVGQSEENVRAVFSQARSAVPCIIFFDELDSLAPNRGRSGDSGGVMDRVVSQLLSELDGLNKKSEVFVIGATNRPDLLDPALLRPGRFDRILYVGIPEDKKSKMNILQALTRKIPLAESVDLGEIIDNCPGHLSGADFYSLCSNAVIQRIEANVEAIESGEKTIEEIDCAVQMEDFLCAMKTIVPSVSADQFKQYQELREKIENV